jgi:hypothetical protein
MSGSEQPLNGWKEIAAYVGKSVRSVQRWETTLGLPVHRIRTPEGQIVYAGRAEIDQWRRNLDAPPTPEPEDPRDPESMPDLLVPASSAGRHEARRSRPRWQWIVVAMALFAAGTLLGLRLGRPSPVAINLTFAGRSLQGLNQQGTVVWSHQFERDVSAAQSTPPPLVDLDGDGTVEWLVPVRSAMSGAQAGTSDALYCFTQDGRVKWSVRPDQTLTYPNRTMSAPWLVSSMAVSPAAPRRVWIAFHHHTGGSSFVVEIGPAGTPTLRYVQAGRIYSVAHWITPAGGFLAVGGASDEHRRPALALLPENDPPATFPSNDSRRVGCAECPPGRPQRVFLFPPSELTTAAHELHPYVQHVRVVGPTLKVVAYQGRGHSQFVVNSDFTVGSFQYAQTYWGAHKHLELMGRIDHSAEQCPDRFTPAAIREWTPVLGWRESHVQPGPRPST